MNNMKIQAQERSRNIPASALHHIHRLVEQKKSDSIALHIGEAHIGVPQHVRDAYVKAIYDGHSSYCDAYGLPELCEVLSASVAEKTKTPVPAGRLFVTPGSCQAISAVLMSLASDGCSALLPEIHWPMHLQQVHMVGLQPRFYNVAHPGMSPVESLEAAYDESVRVMIVNSPSNPLGQVIDQVAMKAIYEWAQSRGVFIISDEAYEDFIYEGEASIMSKLDGEVEEKDRLVFSIRTFSKSYSMTGYRLGYVVAPNCERAELLLRVQEATLVAPSTPVQYAGLAAQSDRNHIEVHHQYVKQTRDEVIKLLAPAGLLWETPKGGWYAILNLSNYTDNADVFCRELLDSTNLALAPGRSFAPKDHKNASSFVRMALCRERQYTIEGAKILLNYLSQRK